MVWLTEVQCEQGLLQIEQLIGQVIQADDGDAIAGHVACLVQLQGFSAQLMASCEYYKFTRKTPTHRAMYTLAERLNAALGKSVMGYQSLLSKLREERKLAQFGG